MLATRPSCSRAATTLSTVGPLTHVKWITVQFTGKSRKVMIHDRLGGFFWSNHASLEAFRSTYK